MSILYCIITLLRHQYRISEDPFIFFIMPISVARYGYLIRLFAFLLKVPPLKKSKRD